MTRTLTRKSDERGPYGPHHQHCAAPNDNHEVCVPHEEWKPLGNLHIDVLRNRVDEFITWARQRIEQCRADELKFPPHSDAAITAWTERRSLLAALRIIRGEAA